LPLIALPKSQFGVLWVSGYNPRARVVSDAEQEIPNPDAESPAIKPHGFNVFWTVAANSAVNMHT
jgi:hypothetical protein